MSDLSEVQNIMKKYQDILEFVHIVVIMVGIPTNIKR